MKRQWLTEYLHGNFTTTGLAAGPELVVFPGNIPGPGPGGPGQRHGPATHSRARPGTGEGLSRQLPPCQSRSATRIPGAGRATGGACRRRRGRGPGRRSPVTRALTAATSVRRRPPSRGTNCLLPISPEPRAIEQTELRGKTKSTGHGAHKLEVERPHTRRRRF